MTTIRIDNRDVGEGHPCYVIAELGINHNGDLELAKLLIEEAAAAGCDAVKFQKRTVDVVYGKVELERPRESPFGRTNGDLKHGLEFGQRQYDAIDSLCRKLRITWFASCWDEEAVDFIADYNVPCFKVASACLTDERLLRLTAKHGRPVILSTGMSSQEQVDAAVLNLRGVDVALLHCVSTYPSDNCDLNLRCIRTLAHRYEVPVGYSGHEIGLATTLAAVAMGACIVERHMTLDRSLWGSDHAASIEPHAMEKLVRDIRAVEEAMGDGLKRVLDAEVPIAQKLRRVG